MDLLKIYQYALSRERQGKEFFETNAARMAHAAAAGMFARLAREEERHIQFIAGLLRALTGHPEEGSGTAQPPDDFFGLRAGAESLDQAVIESMIPDIAILRTAYLIERDFAEFYEQAAAKAEGEPRDALIALARWERGHERLFKDLHDRVFQEYAGMPWGG